ncbi:MAG TPA: hypothetical protein PLF51_17055, partial [Candidatus Hydrogenedentes bacterium]|nr:hypothetical protein [Candidatus Hydrogenedentota bacterium]
ATAFIDTECRGRYFALAEDLDNAIRWFDLNAEDVHLDDLNKHAIWTHADLADALLRAKKRVFAETVFHYTNSAGQPVRLSLLDVERRLYDLSFDPNHPPELRWGAAPGSAEARSAISKSTPLPDGDEVPMEEAYLRQAYYRSLSHWEPERSHLREMFTGGFPVRDKLDETFRRKWFDAPSHPLVPHNGKAAWLKAADAASAPGASSLATTKAYPVGK